MDIEKIIELRKVLHQHAEPSMQETKTKEILMDFLRQNTSFTVVDRGAWFYAVKKGRIDKKVFVDNKDLVENTDLVDKKGLTDKKGVTNQPPIAFRADFDAVVCGDGKARHLCGHDGHSAALAGLAVSLEAAEEKVDRDVYLIFQPGEEIGRGGKICADLIEEKQIGEIYGFHNIPGYEESQIILPEKTFACASTGLKIDLTGKISHAAYPEQGSNPALAIADLVRYMDDFVKKEHKGIVLGTVIGMDAGSDSYGVSAGRGELRLTLRAEYQEEFELLVSGIEEKARALAQRDRLECQIERVEEFPATINHPDGVEKIKKAAADALLEACKPEEPFRWSEDFGYYLQKTGGAFFGIGCGLEHPGLHTMGYEFNDRILMTAVQMFRGLC